NLAFALLVSQREVGIADLIEDLLRKAGPVIADGDGDLPGIPADLDAHMPGRELQRILNEIAEPVQQRRAVLQARFATGIAMAVDLQAYIGRSGLMRF